MIIEKNELYHYGVLGMKWGMRRWQNPDGTLTEAGKRHYARTGGADYKSMSTHHYENVIRRNDKRLRKQYAKGTNGEPADTVKAQKYKRRINKAMDRLEKSKVLDQQYFDYAKKTSTGKAVLQNLIFGPYGARTYQQLRATGDWNRLSAAGMAVLTNVTNDHVLFPAGSIGARAIAVNRKSVVGKASNFLTDKKK